MDGAILNDLRGELVGRAREMIPALRERAAPSQVGTAWDPQATNYGKALFDPRA